MYTLHLFSPFLFFFRKNDKDKPVKYHEVSFICPAGWKVADKNSYGTSRYIGIEKVGNDSSGILTMNFSKIDFNPEEILETLQNALRDQPSLSNLVFNDVKEAYYGVYRGISSAYTFEVDSFQSRGEIFAFEENGTTLAIMQQEAIEDQSLNYEGFEKIKRSLMLK